MFALRFVSIRVNSWERIKCPRNVCFMFAHEFYKSARILIHSSRSYGPPDGEHKRSACKYSWYLCDSCSRKQHARTENFWPRISRISRIIFFVNAILDTISPIHTLLSLVCGHPDGRKVSFGEINLPSSSNEVRRPKGPKATDAFIAFPCGQRPKGSASALSSSLSSTFQRIRAANANRFINFQYIKILGINAISVINHPSFFVVIIDNLLAKTSLPFYYRYW